MMETRCVQVDSSRLLYLFPGKFQLPSKSVSVIAGIPQLSVRFFHKAVEAMLFLRYKLISAIIYGWIFKYQNVQNTS